MSLRLPAVDRLLALDRVDCLDSSGVSVGAGAVDCSALLLLPPRLSRAGW